MSRATGRGTRAPKTPAPAAVDVASAVTETPSPAGPFGSSFDPSDPSTWVHPLTADQTQRIARIVLRRKFNPDDSATWPMTMKPQHVAAIYQRTPGAVRKACQHSRFSPAPFKKRPYLWRRVDVLRDVEGARGGFMRKAG